MPTPAQTFVDDAADALRAVMHEALDELTVPELYEVLAAAGTTTHRLSSLLDRIADHVSSRAATMQLRHDQDLNPQDAVKNAVTALRSAAGAVRAAGPVVNSAQEDLAHLAETGRPTPSLRSV